MNIKAIAYRFLAVIAILSIASCKDEALVSSFNGDQKGVEMTGFAPSMTRAGQVAELKDYVGKSEFEDRDRAVFTTIKRTMFPINQFTYRDIEFACAVSESAEGMTSVGWSRDKNTGTTGATTETHPDRIYWSDATSAHTFTGFCAPQQHGGKAFDWKEESGAYYGSIGDPTQHTSTDIIDYRSTYDGEGNETQSGNVELCKNDILLTHSDTIKAQDAIAKLYFYHGLAQVRVIVNISDFAAGGGADTLSKVSDMVLADMLTMYKWRKNSVATEELGGDDQAKLNTLYPDAGVTYNQRKDMRLWIPEPKGVGWKSSRTFTFYGMAVPTEIPAIDPKHPEDALTFSFNVTYPNPMHPTELVTHPYKASIGGIRFSAGKCTTIRISLNHKNEKMTVGAEYDDWEFIDNPDQGELKKNSTFLSSTERTAKDGNYNVTIIGDQNATADDATWLFVDVNDGNKIKDIYGNDGSQAQPFQISTADQLLSFAYEVKGTNRTRAPYHDLDGTDKTLSNGFDFTGYYVALDAGLTLQATEKKTQTELLLQNPNIDPESSEYTNAPTALINWIGIGAKGKPFNGDLMGGSRIISRLYGSPFFIELGPKAHVGQLVLESVIDILGDGGFANVNNGIICACEVEGNVRSEAVSEPVGSFVGINNGLVFACYHIGDLTATSASTVGGLIGYNDAQGKIVASYNMGKITGPVGNTYGVLGQNTTGSELSIIGCFYDRTKASNISNVAPQTALNSDYSSAGKTTVELMKSSFVGAKESTSHDCLNGIINSWATANEQLITSFGQQVSHFTNHYYYSQPANYPKVY